MAHHNRDESLLLLAHGALDFPTALSTRLHLLTCRECRLRFEHLRLTSIQIAGAIRSPDMPRWAPTSVSRMPSTMIAILILTAIILIGIATEVVTSKLGSVHRPANTAPISLPCKPGLPNDKCR